MASELWALGGDLLGNIFTSRRNSNQLRKSQEAIQKHLNRRRTELDHLFDRNYYQHMMDRSEVQNALTGLRRAGNERMQQFRNKAVVAGATPEVAVAQMNGVSNAYGDAVTKMTAQESRRRDGVMADYINQRTALDNKEFDVYNQRFRAALGMAERAQQNMEGSFGKFLPKVAATLGALVV